MKHVDYVKIALTSKIQDLLKYGAHWLRRKVVKVGRIDLQKELLNPFDFESPKFPAAIFRSFLKGLKESAEKICEHEFELFGESPEAFAKLGKNIDWEKGFSFDFPRGTWELSRFQFLLPLIKAYEVARDEKYALEAKNLIRDWILKNPLGLGINWQCAMEVAIRACNFSLAWFFFKDCNSWKDEKWKEKFLESIIEHGKFIFLNLEYRPHGNTNHLIADLTGLLFLGTLFPSLRDARKWKAKAKKELEIEMERQVYEDGVDYEASIPYHGLVCELFGFSALVGELNGIHFSPEFMSKLEKMFEFAVSATKPNGFLPQIGDSDDGHLFKNLGGLQDLGSALFPLNNFFIQEDPPGASITSKGFNESRIFIMRKNDFYCIVDCGDVGQKGNGGHAHNDTLSFELFVNGEDFIIDPGTYAYNLGTKTRHHFRGTRMHNTVMIDGEEMNRFKSHTNFSIHNDAIPQVNKWESNENYDELHAQHFGYSRLESPITHHRFFRFNKKNFTLEMKDFFEGTETHDFEWNFHFAPGVVVEKTGRNVIATKNGVKIEMELPKELAEKAKITDGDISARYGVTEKAKVLNIKLLGCETYDKAFYFSFK